MGGKSVVQREKMDNWTHWGYKGVACTVVEREDGHTGDIRCNTGDIKELLALFAIRVM